MIFELAIASFLGILVGVVTGLLPGIHVNLIAAIVAGNITIIGTLAAPLPVAVFLCAIAVTHTFLDAIPSIYLGAPDESMADAALPGHKLLLEGRGYEAVRLTVIGSLGSAIFSGILFWFFIWLIMASYPFIRPVTGWLLVITITWLVLREKSILWAATVLLLSGGLGLIVLNSTLDDPLFPMLSGLFGASTLILSLREESNVLPPQKSSEFLPLNSETAWSTIGSTVAGFIAAFLPGLGSAQSGTIIRTLLPIGTNEGILVLQGGINTVNFLLSFATLLAIEKARNGVIVALMEFLPMEKEIILILVLFSLLVCFIAAALTLLCASTIGKFLCKIPYRKLTCTVLVFVSLLVAILTGFWGIVVYIIAAGIGLIAPTVGISRSFGMGCLLIPTTLYFF